MDEGDFARPHLLRSLSFDLDCEPFCAILDGFSCRTPVSAQMRLTRWAGVGIGGRMGTDEPAGSRGMTVARLQTSTGEHR